MQCVAFSGLLGGWEFCNIKFTQRLCVVEKTQVAKQQILPLFSRSTTKLMVFEKLTDTSQETTVSHASSRRTEAKCQQLFGLSPSLNYIPATKLQKRQNELPNAKLQHTHYIPHWGSKLFLEVSSSCPI